MGPCAGSNIIFEAHGMGSYGSAWTLGIACTLGSKQLDFMLKIRKCLGGFHVKRWRKHMDA